MNHALLSVSALTERVPAAVLARRAAAAASSSATTVFTMPGAAKPLYQVTPSIKPRTVSVLVNYALERLKPFGIPDLANWSVEVLECDDDYQVDFVNSQGARLSVDCIQLTPNKCGVVLDYGISAKVD